MRQGLAPRSWLNGTAVKPQNTRARASCFAAQQVLGLGHNCGSDCTVKARHRRDSSPDQRESGRQPLPVARQHDDGGGVTRGRMTRPAARRRGSGRRTRARRARGDKDSGGRSTARRYPLRRDGRPLHVRRPALESSRRSRRAGARTVVGGRERHRGRRSTTPTPTRCAAE